MKKVILQRVVDDGQTTFGVISVDNRPICLSIENTWKDNRPNVSCVPAGLYPCNRLVTTKAHGPTFRLNMTEMNRLTGITRFNVDIHPGNDHTDTEGCILPVRYFATIHGVYGGAYSVYAFRDLMKAIGPDAEIELGIRNIQC